MANKDAFVGNQKARSFAPRLLEAVGDTVAVTQKSNTQKSAQARTSEIPRSEWAVYFKSFGDRHKRCMVSRESFDPDLGRRVAAFDTPLLGIAVQVGDDGREVIVLALGEEPRRLSRVIVEVPEHVWLRKNEAGADEEVGIETRTDAGVVLRLTPGASGAA